MNLKKRLRCVSHICYYQLKTGTRCRSAPSATEAMLKPRCVLLLNHVSSWGGGLGVGSLTPSSTAVPAGRHTKCQNERRVSRFRPQQQINGHRSRCLGHTKKEDLTKVGRAAALRRHDSSNCTNVLATPHSYGSVAVSQRDSNCQKQRNN